jgi:hypothetical protein
MNEEGKQANHIRQRELNRDKESILNTTNDSITRREMFTNVSTSFQVKHFKKKRKVLNDISDKELLEEVQRRSAYSNDGENSSQQDEE